MTSTEEIPKPSIFNEAADYWRYKIGANCFPFDTQKNRTIDGFEWKPYQNKPIPLAMHEHWKRNNMFDKGIAIILGKVWHREECKDYFLYVIDCDNQKAIDEVCTIVNKKGEITKFTLSDISKHCIVEKHSDDQSSCHIIGYSCKQLKTRSIVNDELKLEVKADSKHLINVSPSLHKNGSSWAPIENCTLLPSVDAGMEKYLNAVFKRNGGSRKNTSVSRGEENDAEKPKFYIQKYEGSEAILIDGIPRFIEIVDSQVILHEEIALPDMTLKPLNRMMYLNKEYSFSSLDEVNQYVSRVSLETFDSVYEKVKAIWSKYIDTNEDHLTICAANTVFTYFQDKLGMTHYILFIGDNDTGKSNNLKVFQYTGYRPLFDTSITSANIYQFLGSIEEGQGIILEDEADSIDQDIDKMKIYKVGYQSGTKVTRTDLSGGRKQDSYWTYCFKAFSAERQPNNTKAKGFMERVFVLPCSTGNPKYDITEVINPAGDQKQELLLEELNDIRKLLIIFRLVNYKKTIPDIELNIKNRDKQLCKPLLRLFQNATCVNKISATLSKYLEEKRQRKADTLDARLYEIIVNLIAVYGVELDNKTIWEAVKGNIDGNYDPSKPLSYDTEEFYKLSQIKVTAILVDKFGAEKIRIGHAGTRTLKFDQNTLNRLAPNYAKAEPIEIIKEC